LKKLTFRILLIVLPVALLYAAIALSPLKYGYPFASIINKRDLVKSCHERNVPMMVFHGGSNLWVGLDSATIQRELGFQVINTGVYGGFGIAFMLDAINQYLRPHDIVVIMPGYDTLADGVVEPRIETRKWCLALSAEKSYGRIYKDWKHAGLLLADISGLSQYKIIGVMRALAAGDISNIIGHGYVKYSKKANQYGDSLRNEFPVLPASRKEGYKRKLVFDRINPQLYTFLNDFYRDMEQRHVKVFFAFDALPREEYDNNAAQFEKLSRSLQENLRIPLLGSPEAFTLDYTYFSNSVNHLTLEGRALRTKKLISYLKDRLP
jgi:hypothetical protein